MKKFHVNKDNIKSFKTNLLNNPNLRSDLKNNNIYDTYLVPQGYVGNRPSDFKEEYHEDDTWAIDAVTEDNLTVDSYLYVSEHEYKEDLKTLKL